VRSDIFALSYQEYWQGFRSLFGQTDVIAIGEPVSSSHGGLRPRLEVAESAPSGHSDADDLRPCGYWPGAGDSCVLFIARSGVLETAPFVEARTTPEPCVVRLLWSLPWRFAPPVAAS